MHSFVHNFVRVLLCVILCSIVCIMLRTILYIIVCVIICRNVVYWFVMFWSMLYDVNLISFYSPSKRILALGVLTVLELAARSIPS